MTVVLQILQLVLGEEVSPDRSSAQRSQTTGKLLITIPKVGWTIRKSLFQGVIANLMPSYSIVVEMFCITNS